MHTDIKVGLSCNNNCIHCIMWPIKSSAESNGSAIDSPLSDIIDTISKAKNDGFDSITLTGGEITVRNDLLSILQHACSLGLHTTIQTNGRLLANFDFSSFQPYRDNIEFVIALHGSSSKIHDSITREIGSFDQTLLGIKHSVSYGFSTVGKLVISRANLNDIDAALRLMKELTIKEVLISFPHAEDFSPDNFDLVVPSYRDIQPTLAAIQQDCVLEDVKISFETIPYCLLPSQKMWRHSIDLTTRVNELKSGNDSIIQVPILGKTINWTNTRKRIKTKDGTCQSCLLDFICEGVWPEYADHFGTSELHAVTDQSVIDKFIHDIETL